MPRRQPCSRIAPTSGAGEGEGEGEGRRGGGAGTPAPLGPPPPTCPRPRPAPPAELAAPARPLIGRAARPSAPLPQGEGAGPRCQRRAGGRGGGAGQRRAGGGGVRGAAGFYSSRSADFSGLSHTVAPFPRVFCGDLPVGNHTPAPACSERFSRRGRTLGPAERGQTPAARGSLSDRAPPRPPVPLPQRHGSPAQVLREPLGRREGHRGADQRRRCPR